MHIDKNNEELCWISFILRISMASLFAVAAIGKFVGGIGATVTRFEEIYKATWLPLWMVTPYAHTIAFAEVIVAVWLLSGYKLKEAWIFTAAVLISLAFGMAVAQQYATAADNYIYVVISCLGLYLSRYDCCVLGKKK